jgi:hypothetical protein
VTVKVKIELIYATATLQLPITHASLDLEYRDR